MRTSKFACLGMIGCGVAAVLVARSGVGGPSAKNAMSDTRFVDNYGMVHFDREGFPIAVNPHSGIAESGNLSDPGALMACWSSEAPPSAEDIALWTARMPGAYGGRYNVFNRWAGSQGDPIVITWSLVPDGTAWDGANNNLFTSMDAKFGGNRALWISIIEASFARWSVLTGATYQRVSVVGQEWDDGASFGANSTATRGMVRIGSRNIDGLNGILGYNVFPQNGDMVLDSSENWGSATSQYRSLRNIVMHEHGHGMGLAHTCPVNSTKLMEPGTSLPPSYDGPQQDDIRAMQRSYGDPFEPNNIIVQATLIDGVPGGTQDPISAGSTIVLGNLPANYAGQPNPANSSILSLDANGEVDFFEFDLAASRLVTITATPVGSTYTDLPQLSNGSCATTPLNGTNSLAIADIVVDVLTPSGALVLSQNTAASGLNEVVSNVLLPVGSNVIRVSEADAPAVVQLYRLSVQVFNNSFTLTATDGTFLNVVRNTWTAVPGATQYRLLRGTTNLRSSATTVYTGTAITFDDPAPVGGTTYFYFVDVQQAVSGTSWKQVATDTGARSTNIPPNSNAGPDIYVIDVDRNGSEDVTVDGSASNDPDGTITQWQWFRSGGPQFASTPITTLNCLVGPTTLLLTVRDNGNAFDNDSVLIIVNQRPLADAGPDQTLIDSDSNGFESVTLNGAASTDNGTITSYVWRVAGSQIATGASPIVSLPLGINTVELTCTDNLNETETDTVVITINGTTPVECPDCPADYNQDGGVTGDDIAAFFLDYELGSGCADTNVDGGITGDDIAAFFIAYESGGC